MDKITSGWINGFIGVLIFSGSLPATRAAVAGFDPIFVTGARATIAAALALALLVAFREKRPMRTDLGPLFVTAMGVVVGFPLLTALALRHITSAHSIVFIGLLPLATAIFGVLRGGERMRPMFWLFSCAGSLLVAGFALTQNFAASLTGDLLMFAAIVVCGLGYAEGAQLSRKLGGWQVICWALVLSSTSHVTPDPLCFPVGFERHQAARLDWPLLRLAFFNADRFHFLVSRAGSRRNCGCRSTAVAATLLRSRSRCDTAARIRQLADDCRHCCSDTMRGGRQAVRQIAWSFCAAQ